MTVWLALISYPLYLWHWPLLSIGRILVRNISEFAVRCGAVAVAVPRAWSTWRFVESPVRFGSAHRRPGGRSSLAINAIVALVVDKNKGFPGRLLTGAGLVTYRFDPQSYRSGSCFFEGLKEWLFRDCVEPPVDGEPLIILGGDSHAGHLCPGLRATGARRWSASISPSESNAAFINDEIVPRARDLHQHTVILADGWGSEDVWRALDATFEALRTIGSPSSTAEHAYGDAVVG